MSPFLEIKQLNDLLSTAPNSNSSQSEIVPFPTGLFVVNPRHHVPFLSEATCLRLMHNYAAEFAQTTRDYTTKFDYFDSLGTQTLQGFSQLLEARLVESEPPRVLEPRGADGQSQLSDTRAHDGSTGSVLFLNPDKMEFRREDSQKTEDVGMC